MCVFMTASRYIHQVVDLSSDASQHKKQTQLVNSVTGRLGKCHEPIMSNLNQDLLAD